MDEQALDLSQALAAWRATRTDRLTLPSGMVATVRRVTVLDLAARGEIPLPLVGQVQAYLDATSTGSVTVDVESFPRHAAVVNLVFQAAMVSPPVGAEASAAQLGVDEAPILDRLAVFNWAQQEGAQLITFPAQPDAGAPPARGRPRVPVPAE